MAENTPGKKEKSAGNPNNLYWIYGVIITLILLSFYLLPEHKNGEEINARVFKESLVRRKLVDQIHIVNQETVEVFLTPAALQMDEFKDKVKKNVFGSGTDSPYYFFKVDPTSVNDIVKYCDDHSVAYKVVKQGEYFNSFINIIIPFGLIMLVLFFLLRRIGGGVGGSQIFNIGKSRASLFDKESKVKTTFNDVAGLEEAKQEVVEIVDFLKSPAKFTRLGGHIPKGVLLVGPPGTGKTLLAKAVAGEAQVPFFSLSGSDFVEMFVGVGAARVRDLFKQAKEKAPCIIFIDEIDAIGRSRGRANFTGGNDERENTLNQLLVEMDGFNTDSGVILMAATNRPDVLDNALLRPGRFDRQISVDRPDLKERAEIFHVHLQRIVKSPDLDVKKLAAQTPGFVGADIMNVCNEAALIAARNDKAAVEMQDFHDAIDRVIGGLEKKNKIISPEEKKVIAYHESGHAIAGWFLEHADPLVKVTIVPRGIALGYAQYLPREQYITTYDQLFDTICMALGGRAAEEIIFDKISTGALSDLERITKLAYGMVSVYGMNDKIGNVSFNDSGEEFTFNKPYSEATAKTIDEEVRALIQKAHDRVRDLLILHREGLERVAQELLKREVVFQDDLEKMLGPRPNNQQTAFQNFLNEPTTLNGHAKPADTPVETPLT